MSADAMGSLGRAAPRSGPAAPRSGPAAPRGRRAAALLLLLRLAGGCGAPAPGPAPAAPWRPAEPPQRLPATQMGVGLDPTRGLHTPGAVQRLCRFGLRDGQTVAAALAAQGVAAADVNGALSSMAAHLDFRRMRAGDALTARFDGADRLISVDVARGPLERARADRAAAAAPWLGTKVAVVVEVVPAEVVGAVVTSLWDALVGHGEDARLVAALVDIFAYDIDFYTEVRPRDRFALLVDKHYVNGQFVAYGAVQAAEFRTGELAHRAFVHDVGGGHLAYYDERGRSLRKQLLRAPLKYGPVTSGFGVRRHPILGYTRNHNGTDYGVPVGTPVWSVGDGRVVTAGWHGGFGRLVEVSHPNGWVSQYAHLSRISVRLGQRVQQRDVVGLVGQTGLATGPHLHYGLKKNGHYVNSLAQKFERQRPLEGAELDAYAATVARLGGALSRLQLAAEGRPAAAAQKG